MYLHLAGVTSQRGFHSNPNLKKTISFGEFAVRHCPYSIGHQYDSMNHERFYQILNLYLKGEASKEEVQEMRQLVDTHADLAAIYRLFVNNASGDDDDLETMQAYTAHYVKMQLLGLFDEEKSRRLRSSAESNELPRMGMEQNKPRKLHWLYASTAMIVMAIIAIILVQQHTLEYGRQQNSQQTVHTARGHRKSVTLSDGTKIWLNGGSSLLYPANFDADRREVTLTGEAYFEVQHDKKRPFVVRLPNGVDIRVLGTSFNLRSYPDEAKIQTSLIEGKIEVDVQHGNTDKKTITMLPGQKLLLPNPTWADASRHLIEEKRQNNVGDGKRLTSLSSKEGVENGASTELSWITNKLAFQSEQFDIVVSKLEKWYDINIVVTDSTLLNRRFTGIFENRSVRQVLDALKETGNFSYTREADTIKIF